MTECWKGSLARKLRFHVFNFHFLREVSHESFVFTSSTARICGKSRTKASFSLSDFEGRLPRNAFWELADERNSVFCRTKRASEDAWGSLSGGRLRNTLVCTGIMLGSAAHWNCQFRLTFRNLNFQNLKEVSHQSFVFTSSTLSTFWRKSSTKASF